MSPDAAIADGPIAEITGRFQRHCAVRHRDTALSGRIGYGRWGQADGFPVLYLGRPTESVIVEAYRHLVDPIAEPEDQEALARNVAPRILVTVDVAVTRVLDLREEPARRGIGLADDALRCGTDDRPGYAACQQVARAAHRHGLHGLIAPAATRLGETLVLFTDTLPAHERPRAAGADELWTRLPPDPRADR